MSIWVEAGLDVDAHLLSGEVADVAHRGKDVETVSQKPLQSPRLGRRLDDDQTFRHSTSFIPQRPGLVPRRLSRRPNRLLRRAILRPFFGPAQCPYVTRPVTAHSAVELQGGEPADHLGDGEMQLSSQVG